MALKVDSRKQSQREWDGTCKVVSQEEVTR